MLKTSPFLNTSGSFKNISSGEGFLGVYSDEELSSHSPLGGSFTKPFLSYGMLTGVVGEACSPGGKSLEVADVLGGFGGSSRTCGVNSDLDGVELGV